MKKKALKSDSPIGVFIADANRMVIELMARALRESHMRIAVVGSARDSAEVLKGVGENPADVAVISAGLSDGPIAGFQVAREVRVSHPHIHIIMLVDSLARTAVIEAFRAGADGVFSRDEPFEMLCKCIRAVYEGQVWAGSKQLRFVVEALAKSEPEHIKSANGMNLLTKKEEGLVHCVAEGLTNRDIARQLSLSEHTVRNYLFRIFNKLGTSTRLELALYAINQREASHVSDFPTASSPGPTPASSNKRPRSINVTIPSGRSN
jgi:DNA-binding NarL/FixJ family response regulator